MKTNYGMALVEIVIGASIISVAMLAIVSSYNVYLNYALANQNNVQASYLIEEALEVFTGFRDKGWTTYVSKLSTTTTYYLSFSGSSWATTTAPQYVDGVFLRSVVVRDINRDGGDNISSSGVYDPNTKEVIATVEYRQGHATTTRSISTYITNMYAN